MEFKTVGEIELFNRSKGFDFLDSTEYKASENDPVYGGQFFIVSFERPESIRDYYKIVIVSGDGLLRTDVFNSELNSVFRTKRKAIDFINKYLKAISYLNNKYEKTREMRKSENHKLSAIVFVRGQEETVRINFQYEPPLRGKTLKYVRFKIDYSELGREGHSERVISVVKGRKIFTRDIFSFYELLLGTTSLF